MQGLNQKSYLFGTELTFPALTGGVHATQVTIQQRFGEETNPGSCRAQTAQRTRTDDPRNLHL